MKAKPFIIFLFCGQAWIFFF